MSRPVIDIVTSADDGKVGAPFSFGPSASNTPFSWRVEQMPPGLTIQDSATFTANAGTDYVTVTANVTLVNGLKLRMASSTTLPAGLSAATDVYVINADPDTGTGTHHIWNPETLGQISGIPTKFGFWNTKIYASNADGECLVPLELPIGIQQAATLLPGTPTLKWDLQTNEVSLYSASVSGGSSTSTSSSSAAAAPAPILFGTNQDVKEFGIVLFQGDQIIDLGVHTLNLGIKDFETDPIILLGDSSFTKVGQDNTAAYVIPLDFTAVPDSPSKVLDDDLEENYADDKGTGFDGLAQLQMTYISPVTGNLLKISSRVFDARIERAIPPA